MSSWSPFLVPLRPHPSAANNEFCCIELPGCLQEDLKTIIDSVPPGNEKQTVSTEGVTTTAGGDDCLVAGEGEAENIENRRIFFGKNLSLTLTFETDSSTTTPQEAVLRVGNKELKGKIEKLPKALALARPCEVDRKKCNTAASIELSVYGFVTQKIKFETRPTSHWT